MRARLPFLAGLPVAALLIGALPAQAGPLLGDMADKALKCGIDPGFYVDAKAQTFSTFAFSDNGDTFEDVVLPLKTPALIESSADRFVVEVPATKGAKPLRLAFVRALEKVQGGGDAVQTVVSVMYDGDTVGEPCFIETGRKAYLEDRFNSVRESVCGNDPAPTCEDLLARTCGAEPTSACTAAAAPELARASKAYFDKMNAKAGHPTR
ncbi:hypothetical protein ACLBXM_08740 [Xanthobacteraceae bacterium A53D]